MLTPETGGSGNTGEMSPTEATPPVQASEQEVQAPEAAGAPTAGLQVEGRRTQLKIVRESIQSLSKDVGNFKRSHEASSKRLEAQIASLRKELAQARSQASTSLTKSHEASSKRLEKQVATLRDELAAMRSGMAKEAARSRARDEAMLSRILAKVSAKPPKPVKRSNKR